MNFKSDMICNICEKFLNDPISLPCHCSVCNEHLLTSSALTTKGKHVLSITSKSIKCRHCRKEFPKFDMTAFKRNDLAEKILKANLHLSDEERELKNALTQTMQQRESSLGQFKETNSQFERGIEKHFAGVKCAISLQLDELKTRLEKIAREMTARVDEREKTVLSDMKQSYIRITKLNDESELESKHLLEEFRQTNLNIQCLKHSVNTQEANLVELKRNIDEFKLEIDRVCSIGFRENSSVTDETFGALVLNPS